MTSSSYDDLVCECGHVGKLRCRENDQPFSGLWMEYSLEGFQGGRFSITDMKQMPKDILGALHPICPECGAVGKVKYTKGS